MSDNSTTTSSSQTTADTPAASTPGMSVLASQYQAHTQAIFRLSSQAHQLRRDGLAGNSAADWPQLVQARELVPVQRGRGLRVLWVTYNYPALSETYIASELRWMQSRGIEAHIYRANTPDTAGQLRAPTYAGDLAECLQLVKPHVAHVHFLSMLMQSRSLFERANIPVTVRGHSFDHHDAGMINMLSAPWVKQCYLFPSLLSTTSAALAQAGGAASAVQQKLVAMPVGFDSTRYPPSLQKDPRLVVRLGAGRDTKDYGFLFKVAQACPEYRFVLVLARLKREEAYYARLAEENWQHGNRVQIIYDMQHEDAAALMKRAGIYLHTFKFEHPVGMPISIAESMATGAIPLLRDHPAFRQYGGDAALYYGDVNAAIGHLKAMLDWTPGQWQQRTAAAAERAYREYADSWVMDRLLDDWIRIVQSQKPTLQP